MKQDTPNLIINKEKPTAIAAGWTPTDNLLAWIPFHPLETNSDKLIKQLDRLQEEAAEKNRTIPLLVHHAWQRALENFIPYFPTKSMVLCWENKKARVYPLRQPVKQIGIEKMGDSWYDLFRAIDTTPSIYLIEIDDLGVKAYEIRNNSPVKIIDIRRTDASQHDPIESFIHAFTRINVNQPGLVLILMDQKSKFHEDGDRLKKNIPAHSCICRRTAKNLQDTWENIKRNLTLADITNGIMFWHSEQQIGIHANEKSYDEIEKLVIHGRIDLLIFDNVENFLLNTSEQMIQRMIEKRIRFLKKAEKLLTLVI